QHLGAAVDAGGVEAGLEQSHRVEAGAGRGVEDRLHTVLAQQVDEEAALALVPTLPVDELVPLVDEALVVLLGVVVALPDRQRVGTERLVGMRVGPALLCYFGLRIGGASR